MFYFFRTFLTIFCLAVLAAAAYTDLKSRTIQNGQAALLFAAGCLSVFLFPEIGLADRLLGSLCVSVPLFAAALFFPGSFGGGDIKLMAAGGMLLGWPQTFFAFAFSVFLAGGQAFWLLAVRKKGRKTEIAFGPYLCAGIAVFLLAGESLTGIIL